MCLQLMVRQMVVQLNVSHVGKDSLDTGLWSCVSFCIPVKSSQFLLNINNIYILYYIVIGLLWIFVLLNMHVGSLVRALAELA